MSKPVGEPLAARSWQEELGPLGTMLTRGSGAIDLAKTCFNLPELERRFFAYLSEDSATFKPPVALEPLDGFILMLAGRSRPPKLMTQPESPTAVLSNYENAYFHARLYIFMAIAKAEIEAAIMHHRRTDIRAALEGNEKSRERLTIIARDLGAENYYSSRSIQEIEKTIAVMEEEASRLKIESRDLLSGSGNPDVWKITFVEILGMGWSALTGRAPSAGSGDASFGRFVEVAYETVAPDKPDETWESQIKSAIAFRKRKAPDDPWRESHRIGLSELYRAKKLS